MEVKLPASEGTLSGMVSIHSEQTNIAMDGTDLQRSKHMDTGLKWGDRAQRSFKGSNRGNEKKGHDKDAEGAKIQGKHKDSFIRRVGGSFKRKNRGKSDPCLPSKRDSGETNGSRENTENYSDVGSSYLKIYSVMEVNDLIKQRQLQEAYSIIKTMEKELSEQGTPEASSSSCSDHDRRVRDVEYLYKHLVEKMRSVIKNTLGKEAIEEKLLMAVVNVISEEEGHWTDHQHLPRSHSDTLESPRKWKEVWKASVQESVRERINSVLPPSEENLCFALHLTHLTKRVIEDLMKVKLYVKACYTEDFEVCDTYMNAFHGMVSSHIADSLLSRNLEFKDLYSVLAWVTKTYHSENLMGNSDLKPEFKTESLGPLLDADVLDKLQSDYLITLKATIKKYMENVCQIQNNDWDRENEPDTEILDGIYTSELYIDIQEMIGQHVIESGKISEYLQNETLRICLEEVAQIIPRLVKEFISWDQTKHFPLFMKYFVTYINGFCGIRCKLQTTDTTESNKLKNIITLATDELKKYFFKKLEQQTQPLFLKLLTRIWISSSETFQKLDEEVTQLSQDLKYLGLPAARNPINGELPPETSTICTCKVDFLSGVHKYLIKEYISLIMKHRLRLNRTNRGEAANKMRQEGELLNKKFINLVSESDWLCPAIPLISEVVGVKEEESMKEHLKQLVSTYPDLREEHVSSILYLQGTGRRKKMLMLRYFKKLQKDATAVPDADRLLFETIEVPTHVQCLPFT
ncbi:exocyst complex component 3-like protein 4 isoform X1 [Pleurodeles waltl]|uniref:exocyst complex component 3-like protein 4 isoform X1 n=1 Tax=Pleurodeles waltl TaxID=8319 RepID=UPI0037098556